jgi:Zn finger protein HypA/HybF involved in hydrogenase expression
MPEPLAVLCPHCNARLRVKTRKAEVDCPQCRETFRVPRSDAEVDEPIQPPKVVETEAELPLVEPPQSQPAPQPQTADTPRESAPTLIACKDCQSMFSRSASVCPHCGMAETAYMNNLRSNKGSVVAWGLAGVFSGLGYTLTAPVAYLGIFFDPSFAAFHFLCGIVLFCSWLLFAVTFAVYWYQARW